MISPEPPTSETESSSRFEKSLREPSFLARLQILLHPNHQVLIAWLLVAVMLVMGSYLGWQAIGRRGWVDIDDVPHRNAELKIDINTAEWPELVSISGIGRTHAEAIIAYRQQHGPFKSLASIKNVHGIGDKKLAQLKPFLLPLGTPER